MIRYAKDGLFFLCFSAPGGPLVQGKVVEVKGSTNLCIFCCKMSFFMLCYILLCIQNKSTFFNVIPSQGVLTWLLSSLRFFVLLTFFVKDLKDAFILK
jgi:hypothetical protein